MSFLTPWLLISAGILPLLWWLIRSLPPRPHIQSFSSLLLLRKLSSQHKKAAHTPLWLLLLRLLAVICLILGLAGLYKASTQRGTIPHKLLLVIDNGWASMPQWNQRQQAALRLGLQTLQHDGVVTLLLSAKEENGQWAEPFKTTDIRQFETIIRQLKPSPWSPDRHHLAWQLSQGPLHDFMKEADIAILSDGLAGQADSLLKRTFSASHYVQDVRWPDCSLVLLYAALHGTQIRVMAETMENCPSRSYSLKGLAIEDGGHFTPMTDWPVESNKSQILSIDPAFTISLNALSLSGVPFPAGLALLKAPTTLRTVGLLRQNGDDKPLTGDVFYLRRALENFTKSQDVTPATLKQNHLSVLIASDEALSADDTRKTVLYWVRAGGILIRFAGPGLAKAASSPADITAQSLMTVPLRPEARSLGGTMSWDAPQTLAPFAADTPLSGLPISEDITVKRQLIAQPSDELPHHVWASLKDGTPLVTTRQEGKGRIILFHVTSTADWSDLPLSGLFPQILERLINHAPQDMPLPDRLLTSDAERQLPAWKILSSHGTLADPEPFVLPLNIRETTAVSAEHPVGFYGTPTTKVPLNLSQTEGPLSREIALGELTKPDFSPSRTLLGPFLVFTALILLLTDIILSLGKTFNLRPHLPNRTSMTPFCLLVFLLPGFFKPAFSASIPPEALHPGLGYIISGEADLDKLSQQGLDGLTRYINQRSTAHLGPARGVIPGQDNLAFYPLLYWPLSVSTHIDDKQAAALNDYMAHNGLILIDEMGAGTLVNQTSLNSIKEVLVQISQHLTIPPLEAVTDDSILARTFYLLHDFPGRIAGQTVYSARTHFDEGEDISPIIIGNNDWAHAWAIDDEAHTLYAVIPEDEEQRAQSYRFGMNIVIYALTGNYKYDQRFYPSMLKKLGQDSSSSTIQDQNDKSPLEEGTEEP